MDLQRISSLLIVAPLLFMATAAAACSNGTCKLLDECETDGDCEAGLYCFSCPQGYSGSKCVRSTATPVFNLLTIFDLQSTMEPCELPPQINRQWNCVRVQYATIGLEIWEDTKGKVDGFVAEIGTGGPIYVVGLWTLIRLPDSNCIPKYSTQ